MAVITEEMLARVLEPQDMEFVRASGDVVRSECGRKYYDHPMDKEPLAYNGIPFLNIVCDGTRVKL